MVLTPGQALDPNSGASPGEYNPEILIRGVYSAFAGLSGSIRLKNFSSLRLKNFSLIDLTKIKLSGQYTAP